MKKSHKRTEFGDFQTPPELAEQVCALLTSMGISPASVLEPTCGRGSFLVTAAKAFSNSRKIVGLEINPQHAEYARQTLCRIETETHRKVICADFFSFDWNPLVEQLPQPILVIGNPPWVTNTQLGFLNSTNLPFKSNFQSHRGIDAITGKGNFDISEYMLRCAVDWLEGKNGTLAVLCKTVVARKILRQAWRRSIHIKRASIYLIDANTYFDASVEACLLVIQFAPNSICVECSLHPGLSESSVSTFGFRNGHVVADVAKYEKWQCLETEERGIWRSGIKHDCSRVMQLVREGPKYKNGLGESVDLEDDYLFPMLKSSDLANQDIPKPRYYMLVPQRIVGEETNKIKYDAPKTWKYLNEHSAFLDQRHSSIYNNRPRFSIFGVGKYSFRPWKVGISGLYKKLAFRLVTPSHGRPVVLDDTCYFCSCANEREAHIIIELLDSTAAKEFLTSFIFWDDKRPITAELLDRLDLFALAKELGKLAEFISSTQKVAQRQTLLFDA